MRLSRLPALVLALLLPVPLLAQTAPAASPAARIVARTGATVSPEARRYFGLFPDAPAGTSVDIAPAPGGGLTLMLRSPSQDSTTRALTPELAQDLARYLDRYELLFWDERDDSDIAWELGPSLTRLRREGIAVPATLKREVPLTYTLRMRGGEVVRGRVLYADESVVAIWTAEGSYRWNAPEGIALVPADHVARLDVLGARTVPLAVNGALHVAAAAAALATSVQARAATTGPLVVGTSYRAYTALATRRGADRLRDLARIAFFRRGTPPEFDARMRALRAEPVAPQPPLSLADRWRTSGPWVSVSVARPLERAPQGTYDTYLAGTGDNAAGVPKERIGGTIYRPSPSETWRGDVEVQVPLPRLPIGLVAGAGRLWYGETPTVRNGKASTFEESLSDRTSTVLFGGLGFGGPGGATRGHRLVVAGGVRREQATVSGAFYTNFSPTVGFPSVDDPVFARRYSEDVSNSTPLVRLMYEHFLTRVTSLYVQGEWTRAWAHTVEARTQTATFPNGASSYGYTATRAAHEIRFSGTTTSAGLRLHL